MKKLILMLLALAMMSGSTILAQVAISDDGSTADGSAILHVISTDKGLLIPRLTEAQIATIENPAVGLLVFNTDDDRYYFYDDGPGEWKEIAIGAGTITPIPGPNNPETGESRTNRNSGTGNMAISENSGPAHGSAILDVISTDKGVLVPRLTESQIANISNPAVGLTAFNTDDNRFYFYDDVAGEWKEIALGAGTITPIPPIPTVYNPATGETWMDRNLGASQVATSKNDGLAYGSLYQWGRLTDGHELRSNTGTTTSTSSSDDPGHSDFITTTTSPYDWRIQQNPALWQGVAGTNNPCPEGFSIPTVEEWEAELATWSSNNGDGAYGSPLKLTLGGNRSRINGTFQSSGGYGYYWCSDINGILSRILYFHSTSAGAAVLSSYRAVGNSVRCIKD